MPRKNLVRISTGLLLMLWAVVSTACLDRELKPLTPCLVSGVDRQVKVNNIDKIDLLFMVDNSGSMKDKQRSLREQFPKLIKTLTTGMRSTDTSPSFSGVTDLHLGVVTSDMGVPGVAGIATCSPDGGDDGRLQHTPMGAGCDASYPSFLTYQAQTVMTAANTTPDKLAADFGCIANVGTGGCGFEEQLEAPLKALWPSIYADAKGNVMTPNPVQFLATTQQGTLGRGDVPVAQGGNLGFLRKDSLLGIVIVTDEEDCSSRSTDMFKPRSQLAKDSPYYNQDINLRCYYNKEPQYDVNQRYYQAFQRLRPGSDAPVVFAAIVGVPIDLVNADARTGVNFKDTSSRDAYYAKILGDNRMVETIDPSTNPGMGDGGGNLTPSCRGTDSTGAPTTAYPPRRIVQLAQLFGKNATVQSICQPDFGPAMDAIIELILDSLHPVCLPRPLVRKASGLVSCKVVWELPKAGADDASNNTPTVCSQASYLKPVEAGRAPINTRGGNNCEVNQLPVVTTAPPSGSGWYYDDFSTELQQSCLKTEQQRVAFSSDAKPPTGVVIKLECLNETQTLANMRTDVNLTVAQPGIGTACGADVIGATLSGDAACVVTLSNGQPDQSMFCHPDLNVCVQSCTSDTQCPAAWVCDTRPETIAASGKGAYCVNPTCGAN